MGAIREISSGGMPYASDWNLVARAISSLLSSRGGGGLSVSGGADGLRFTLTRGGQVLRLPVSAQIAEAYNSGADGLSAISSAWIRSRVANADGEHPATEASGSETLDVRPVDEASWGRVCVTLDSIDAGKTGRVLLSGIVPVLVKARVDLVPSLGDSDFAAKMEALAYVDMVPDQYYFQPSSVGYRLLWIDVPTSDDVPVLALIDLSQEHGQGAVVVKNNYSGEVPPFGAMEATWDATNKRFNCTRPTADSLSNVLFNDLVAFPAGEFKRVPQAGAIVPALVTTTDIPDSGDSAGTVSGAFHVKSTKSNFACYGKDAGRGVAMVRPFASGGIVNAGEITSVSYLDKTLNRVSSNVYATEFSDLESAIILPSSGSKTVWFSGVPYFPQDIYGGYGKAFYSEDGPLLQEEKTPFLGAYYQLSNDEETLSALIFLGVAAITGYFNVGGYYRRLTHFQIPNPCFISTPGGEFTKGRFYYLSGMANQTLVDYTSLYMSIIYIGGNIYYG